MASVRPGPGIVAGFSLTELLIAVAILGLLSAATLFGLLRSARIGALRAAAIDLAGYLETAQATAAGSTDACSLAISGSGDNQQIGPTNAVGNACAALASQPLLSGSVIPLGLVVTTAGTLTIAPRGTLESPVTIRLSEANTQNLEYCVQLLPPAGLVGTGVYRNNSCDHAAFN